MRQLRTERAQFLVDNLDIAEAAQFDAARWEPFQIAHLEDDSMFRIEDKSRQIAWSWITAAEAVADGILEANGTIFQSVNLQEAQEKMRYAKNVIRGLPQSMRPKLLTDNKQELEFDNGARLISLPGNPQRGKAQMNVVLDEFAHIAQDIPVYTAALPVISKGDGLRLRIGSSPMGAGGRFWEIFKEPMRPYPGYRRKITPWWEVHAFCVDVRLAMAMAPRMTTFERVDRFGNDRIKAIYANIPEMDFRQEYEAVFVDESTAWITWKEIRGVQDDSLLFLSTAVADSITDAATETIDELARLVDDGEVELSMGAGVDVGRTNNATELFIGGITTTGSYPLRLAVTIDNCDFDSQFNVLSYAMERLPIARMLIDRNGIGRNLAENLESKFPGKAEGVNFTNQTKSLWATDAKMFIQQSKTPLPVDRDIAYQIHSIKRKITAAKNMVFDTEGNEKHHADKFWAWALMLSAVKEFSTKKIIPIAAPIGAQKNSFWK